MLASLEGKFPPAILALADGSVFLGQSIGATGTTVGEVLNTTSPVVVPVAPMDWPRKQLPSASARMAGGNFPSRDESTGFSV